MSFPRADADRSRRRFLSTALGTLGVASLAGRRSAAAPELESSRISEVIARAEKSGLARFEVSRSAHFVGVGDAPGPFREEALAVCEALGRVFLKHLQDRGFRVEFPENRMMVVVLRDQRSYSALVGQAPGQDVGGHYELDGDRLFVFDYRPDHDPGVAERINTFTLVHETTHLLSYNTGLLASGKDPGKCVAEGVATYFEMWRRGSRAPVGRVNHPRLEAIREASRSDDASWIDTARLLSDDALFDDPETAQLAYGQAWLLTYSILSSRSLYREAVAWFEAMKKPEGDRVATFEAHLGPVAKFDDRLRKLARELVRG